MYKNVYIYAHSFFICGDRAGGGTVAPGSAAGGGYADGARGRVSRLSSRKNKKVK